MSRIWNAVGGYNLLAALVKRKITVTCYVGSNKKNLLAQCARTVLQLKVLLRSWASRSGIDWEKFYVPSLHDKQEVGSSEITSKKVLRNFTILNCLQSPVIVPFRSSLWWILWRSTGTRSLRTWLQTTAPVSPLTRISCAIRGTDLRPHKDPHYFPILFEVKITLQSYDEHFVITLPLYMQCCGSAMASMLIRIHLLFIQKRTYEYTEAFLKENQVYL